MGHNMMFGGGYNASMASSGFVNGHISPGPLGGAGDYGGIAGLGAPAAAAPVAGMTHAGMGAHGMAHAGMGAHAAGPAGGLTCHAKKS